MILHYFMSVYIEGLKCPISSKMKLVFNGIDLVVSLMYQIIPLNLINIQSLQTILNKHTTIILNIFFAKVGN